MSTNARTNGPDRRFSDMLALFLQSDCQSIAWGQSGLGEQIQEVVWLIYLKARGTATIFAESDLEAEWWINPIFPR